MAVSPAFYHLLEQHRTKVSKEYKEKYMRNKNLSIPDYTELLSKQLNLKNVRLFKNDIKQKR